VLTLPAALCRSPRTCRNTSIDHMSHTHITRTSHAHLDRTRGGASQLLKLGSLVIAQSHCNTMTRQSPEPARTHAHTIAHAHHIHTRYRVQIRSPTPRVRADRRRIAVGALASRRRARVSVITRRDAPCTCGGHARSITTHTQRTSRLTSGVPTFTFALRLPLLVVFSCIHPTHVTHQHVTTHVIVPVRQAPATACARSRRVRD
jgi:hypothetical protein